MKLYHTLLKTSNLQKINQSITSINKQLNNEPFIKNLFNGKYLTEYIKYPEYSLNELNQVNRIVEPIKNTILNSNKNEPFDKLNEFLQLHKLYGQEFPKSYG